MLNSNLTNCIRIEPVENCAYYTTEKCLYCDDSFVQNFTQVANIADIVYYNVNGVENF